MNGTPSENAPTAPEGAAPLQWDDVRHFVAVARAGSLSSAARALAVEHATVARRIGQLEAALGLRLFDRLPRGWRLTPDGEQLMPRALAVETAALALQRQASAQEDASGGVRLSATPLLLNHCVVDGLDALRRRQPGVVLTLVGELRLADLLRGEADLALRLGEPNVPDLISRPVARLHYALYGRAGALPAPGQSQYIGLTEDAAYAPLRMWLDGHIGGRPVVARTNDLECAASLARQGWGLALLPRFLGDADPALAAWPAEPLPAPRTLYLTMHPDVRRAARVRAVADHLVAHLAAQQPRL